jgi:hypothetical protein
MTSFSGIGGVGSQPQTLIAQYKMNENTANDNDDLVTNGGFGADTDWTKETGWTIAGGVADCDGSQVANSNLYQAISVVAGSKYQFIFTLNNRAAGSVRPFVGRSGSVGLGTVRSADNTYTEYIIAGPTTLVGIEATDDFVGDVDDISLKLMAVEDSSGNDHDGLAQQDTDQISVAGKINTAFEFDGATDAVTIPAHTDFAFNSGSFSVAVWLNIDSDGGGNLGRILDKAIGSAGTGAHLFNTSNEVGGTVLLRGKIDAGVGTDATVVLDAGIALNVWQFVVFVFDGTDITIYVNATAPAQTQQSLVGTVSNNTDSDITVGNIAALNRGFDGTIDAVMFFSQALDQNDINFLYNKGNGREELTSYLNLIPRNKLMNVRRR